MRKESGLVKRLPLSLGLWMALFVFSVGIAKADLQDRDGRLIAAGPPIYPSYCFNKRLQGYVDFVFIVDASGLVQDSSVVEAVVFRKKADQPVDDEKAKKAFISAAATALSNYRYEPPVKNGEVLQTEGVRTRITFKLGR